MGKFTKYRIDLRGMREDSATYEFLLDNQYFVDIDGQETQKGKVNATLSVKKKQDAYELTFQLGGIVVVACDRCLDDMDIPVETTEKILVKFGKEYAEEGDNLIVIPEEEGDINVAWFMYEFIVLNIPMKHIHAPGKCNKTMTSKLNKIRVSNDEEENFESEEELSVEEEENIETETVVDPRWNELKKIIDNN